MSRNEKEFDAVAMMRAARDRISAQIEGMTLEEELKWLASQRIDDPFLKRLRDRAAQQADAADRPPAGLIGKGLGGRAPRAGQEASASPGEVGDVG